MDINDYRKNLEWIPRNHELIKNYVDLTILDKISDNELKKNIDLQVISSEPRNWKPHNEASVVFLVQNKEFTPTNRVGLPREHVTNRIELFFQSLHLLLENKPTREFFDIHVFHENDLTEKIISKTRQIVSPYENINIVFHAIQFMVPLWISETKIKKSIHSYRITKPKLAWRDIGYRHMCRFYSFQVFYFLLKHRYKKMMRLDDDSFIMESIPQLFQNMKDNVKYICRLTQVETEDYSEYFTFFTNLYCQNSLQKKLTEQDFQTSPFNNFFILDLSIYQDNRVRQYLSFIDLIGGIYSRRWGDAIVQNALLRLSGREIFLMMNFQYSKWGIVYEKKKISLYNDNQQLKKKKKDEKSFNTTDDDYMMHYHYENNNDDEEKAQDILIPLSSYKEDFFIMNPIQTFPPENMTKSIYIWCSFLILILILFMFYLFNS